MEDDAKREGFVVFKKKGENDEEETSDIWDDTALIKAYDKAVSLAKAGLLDEPTEEQDGQDDKNSDTQKNKKKQKRRKNKKKSKVKWKVGMMCRATFSEDGNIYDAVILSINEEDGTCVVQYDGYGNEEEHTLAELMKTRKRRRNQQSEDGVSENDSAHDGSSGRKFPSFTRLQPPQFHPTMPPPLAPPPMPQNLTNSRMPFIPPPPPPVTDDPADIDNEAMCSMLMSWYMSGYHTGYYQGLKDGRKQTSSRQSPIRPDLR